MAYSTCGRESTTVKTRFHTKYLKHNNTTPINLDGLSIDQIDSLTPEEKGCYQWTDALCATGYGVIWVGGRKRTELAHRISYRIAKGEIPDGMHVDHLCRNRGCVNPEHLELVSLGENILRGRSLQAQNKAKTHCMHGHEFSVENTIPKARPCGGRRCRRCEKIARDKKKARLMSVSREL